MWIECEENGMSLLACAVENNTQITQSYSPYPQQAGRSDNEYFTPPPPSFMDRKSCMRREGRMPVAARRKLESSG